MTRVASTVTAIALALVASASSAAAGPGEGGPPPMPADGVYPPGTRAAVPYASGTTAAAADPISHIIYLNRCDSGCTFTRSSQSDSVTNLTIIGGPSVPNGGQMMIQPWALSEQVWTEYLTCMQQVYGPYDVQIVTEDPSPMPHHEAVVAGRASDMSITGALGIAPLDSSTCTPKNNVISFTFANDHGPDPLNLCWTTAQESAHSFGLDHAFDCTDPLTYLGGCGQKFFRNKDIKCGEFSERPCVCGPLTQNSHQKLLATFGHGTDPAPPTVRVVSPMPGPVSPTFSVFVEATDPRRVSRAELYINGWKWAEKASTSTSTTSTFVLDLPGNVPDGVMDLGVRACNDLDICAAAPIVTVTRGDACVAAAADCLPGQKCETGRCFWDPPAIALGGSCTYDQECLEGRRCADPGNGDGAICTESCFGPPNDRCPDGYQCSAPTGAQGVCMPAVEEEGGCCSTGTTGRGTVLFNLGLGAMIGLMVARRRRRKA